MRCARMVGDFNAVSDPIVYDPSYDKNIDVKNHAATIPLAVGLGMECFGNDPENNLRRELLGMTSNPNVLWDEATEYPIAKSIAQKTLQNKVTLNMVGASHVAGLEKLLNTHYPDIAMVGVDATAGLALDSKYPE